MIVTPANPKELAEAQKFDLEKNDAEIIQMCERAQGRPMKHLDKDTYSKKRIEAKYARNDVEEFRGYRKGQIVRIELSNPIGHDVVRGEIEAISADGLFVRIQGHYYSTSKVKRLAVPHER